MKPQGRIDFGNPLRNVVGNPPPRKKPADKKILEALLSAMARFPGTCWDPVAEVNNDGKPTSWDLMLNQCPGACGHVWKLTLADGEVSRWLVGEINRRHVCNKLPSAKEQEG